MSLLEEIKESVIKGSAAKVTEYTEQAVAESIPVEEILNNGLIAGMNVIGVLFKANEIYVPEVLIGARAMHAGMKVIKPLIAKAEIKEKGVVILGTVKGDLHDIGKKLVSMMLEGAGYRVIDLGVDVPVEKYVQAVEEHKPQVLGMSALLTTTMTQMRTVIEKLQPYRGQLKVMVGGAPVTQKFADEIGADAYASDAASAVDSINAFLAS